MSAWRLGHCPLVFPTKYEPINVHYEKNFICLGLMRSMYETYWIVGLNFMKKGRWARTCIQACIHQKKFLSYRLLAVISSGTVPKRIASL